MRRRVRTSLCRQARRQARRHRHLRHRRHAHLRFKNAPIVIDLHEIKAEPHEIDLEAICALLREEHMIPVGVRGLDHSKEKITIPEGLAVMKAPKSSTSKTEPSLTTGIKNKIAEPVTAHNTNTKLTMTPVRAGTQLYARGGDLVVMAAVNAGGECLADGNIHIYGPLRGKALAGASGNENARIFCESLEAELVAIAGHYLTNEKLVASKSDKPMIQIYLKDGKIHVEGI